MTIISSSSVLTNLSKKKYILKIWKKSMMKMPRLAILLTRNPALLSAMIAPKASAINAI